MVESKNNTIHPSGEKLPRGVGLVPKWWMEITPHYTLDLDEEKERRETEARMAEYFEKMAIAKDAGLIDFDGHGCTERDFGGSSPWARNGWEGRIKLGSTAAEQPSSPAGRNFKTGSFKIDPAVFGIEKTHPDYQAYLTGAKLPPGYHEYLEKRLTNGVVSPNAQKTDFNRYGRQAEKRVFQPSWAKPKLRSTSHGSSIRRGVYDDSPNKFSRRSVGTNIETLASLTPPLTSLEEDHIQQSPVEHPSNKRNVHEQKRCYDTAELKEQANMFYEDLSETPSNKVCPPSSKVLPDYNQISHCPISSTSDAVLGTGQESSIKSETLHEGNEVIEAKVAVSSEPVVEAEVSEVEVELEEEGRVEAEVSEVEVELEDEGCVEAEVSEVEVDVEEDFEDEDVDLSMALAYKQEATILGERDVEDTSAIKKSKDEVIEEVEIRETKVPYDEVIVAEAEAKGLVQTGDNMQETGVNAVGSVKAETQGRLSFSERKGMPSTGKNVSWALPKLRSSPMGSNIRKGLFEDSPNKKNSQSVDMGTTEYRRALIPALPLINTSNATNESPFPFEKKVVSNQSAINKGIMTEDSNLSPHYLDEDIGNGKLVVTTTNKPTVSISPVHCRPSGKLQHKPVFQDALCKEKFLNDPRLSSCEAKSVIKHNYEEKTEHPEDEKEETSSDKHFLKQTPPQPATKDLETLKALLAMKQAELQRIRATTNV